MRFTQIIALMLLSAGLLGCAGDDRPAAAPSWLLLVYMAANDGATFSEHAHRNIRQLEQATFDSAVTVVVQIGQHGANSKRYRIYDGGREELADLGDLDMASEAALTDFLRWAAATYPRERTALILWGHGDGWDQTLRSPEQRLGSAAMLTDATRGGDKLANHRIRRALEAGGLPLDVLGFDGCNMGALEALYEFRESARVLVASQELIPLAGWHYGRLLDALHRQQPRDGAGFGRIAVETYGAHYARYDHDCAPGCLQQQATLSAFRADRLQALATEVDRVAGELLVELEGPGPARQAALESLLTARAEVQTVVDPGWIYVDLADLFDRLGHGAALRQRLDAALLAHYAGPVRATVGGLAIVFYQLPEAQQYNQLNPHYRAYDETSGGGSKAAFLRDNRWPELLWQFYRVAGLLPE